MSGEPSQTARRAHQPRLNPSALAPELLEALLALEQRIKTSGLEPSLIQLVKARASQLNGCTFCVHRHTRGRDAMPSTAGAILVGSSAPLQ